MCTEFSLCTFCVHKWKSYMLQNIVYAEKMMLVLVKTVVVKNYEIIKNKFKLILYIQLTIKVIFS